MKRRRCRDTNGYSIDDCGEPLPPQSRKYCHKCAYLVLKRRRARISQEYFQRNRAEITEKRRKVRLKQREAYRAAMKENIKKGGEDDQSSMSAAELSLL